MANTPSLSRMLKSKQWRISAILLLPHPNIAWQAHGRPQPQPSKVRCNPSKGSTRCCVHSSDTYTRSKQNTKPALQISLPAPGLRDHCVPRITNQHNMQMSLPIPVRARVREVGRLYQARGRQRQSWVRGASAEQSRLRAGNPVWNDKRHGS